jgi:integrase
LPRLHPHGLRHTAASTLLALGMPVPEVAEKMGRASPAITLNLYAHVIPGRRSSGADRTEAYWNPPAEGTNETEGL